MGLGDRRARLAAPLPGVGGGGAERFWGPGGGCLRARGDLRARGAGGPGTSEPSPP